MKGRAHVYKKDHINTDEIIPARYLTSDQEEELAKYAMEDIDSKFVEKVREGDFIISADDFGCGSSREHAVWALRGAGIRAVIANNFARIFYRNCINNGIPAIECPGIVDKVQNGDEINIMLEDGIIHNITTGEKIKFIPIADFAQKMMKAGGLMKYISQSIK